MQSRPFTERYSAAIVFLERACSWALIVLMAAMVCNVLWQVSSRFLLNDPSSYTEEIARFLLIWVGMLGACHAYRVGAHLGLDLLTDKLESRVKSHLRKLVSFAVILLSTTVLINGGGRLVLLTYELKQTSGAMGIPVAWVYAVLPLSGLVLCLYALDDAIGPERDRSRSVLPYQKGR